jgi:hypothetical protein
MATVWAMVPGTVNTVNAAASRDAPDRAEQLFNMTHLLSL